MDEKTKAALETIFTFADSMMDDENQDRTLILEGVMQMILDLAHRGELQSPDFYTRMYTR